TWAIAVVASVLAAIAYAATSVAARLLTPWAREMSADIGSGLHANSGGAGGWAMAIASALGSLGLVLVVWWAILRGFSVPPFFGKGPLEVWNYLVDPLMGAQNRIQLMREAIVTIRDSAAGLVVGTVAAIVVAVAFNLWGGVERAFMGVAIALRSIPLVAMAPLVTLVFGRNMLAVVMIGAIVTFFPTLVNMTLALAQTPARSRDLMRVFGASRFRTLMTVQIPSALPALFTSLRTAAPLAITGALLAAWRLARHRQGARLRHRHHRRRLGLRRTLGPRRADDGLLHPPLCADRAGRTPRAQGLRQLATRHASAITPAFAAPRRARRAFARPSLSSPPATPGGIPPPHPEFPR
ncbi:MAG: ABC transporter permease subunit, partial [Rhizobiales bacterium]|nr:ABC transporter permease subunit [Hyphomicrobiales bacterium]